MKTLTKIIAVLLLLIFLVSTLASSVLADPSSISLTSKWVGNSTQISVTSGDEPELFTSVLSTSNFKLWIDVYDGAAKVKSVINGMNIPANINSPYFNTFKINTDNLGAFGGKNYNVRVHVQNINTGQSTEEWLNLNVKKKFVYIPWLPGPLIPLNNIPVMDSIVNKEVTEGGPELQFNVYGYDEDDDLLTYEAQVCKFSIYGICIYASVEQIGANFEMVETTYGDYFYGQFTWTPDYDFVTHPNLSKNVKVRFRSNDGTTDSEWVYTNILVNDKNRIPYFDIVGNQQVDEGQSLDIPLDGHDLDDDKLSYSYYAEDAAGNVLTDATINKTSHQDAIFRWYFDYSSAEVSPYVVTIWVEDGFGGYRSETFTITVNNVVLDIAAEDLKVSVDEDSSVNIQMFCSGGEGHLTYSIAGGPFHGALSEAAGDSVVYTPNADYNGEDTVRYNCTDAAGMVSNLGTAFIMVNPINDDPVAVDDAAETNEDVPVEIDVLANDYDVDGDAIAIQGISSSPSNGSAVVINGRIAYTPNQGFFGLDRFEYEIYDITGQTDSAMVTVTVTEVEEPVVNQCNDGLDNDGDGLVDYPADPGCVSLEDDDEFNEIEEPVYQCSDGIDNDGDDFIDMFDPGCDHPEDDDEFNEIEEPVYQCNDGLDNDGDGLVDYPADPGCDSPEDDNEFNEIEEPQEPQVSYTNIKFKSVQVAQEGDYAYLNAYLLNNGDKDLEDLRVTAMIYSLGVKSSGSVFALDSGENTSVNVYVPLPYGEISGYYIVKVAVKNTQYHDSVYRLVYLS